MKVPEAIDPEVIVAFYQDAPVGEDTEAFVGELIDLFTGIAPACLARIQAAVRERNAQGLERYAHRLKGTSYNLGARLLAETCELMESLGSKRGFAEAETLLPTLEERYDAARQELLTKYKPSRLP